MQAKPRAPSPFPAAAPALRVAWGLGTGRHLRHAARAGDHIIVFAVDVAPHEAARVDTIVAKRPELVQARAEGRLDIVLGDLAAMRRRFDETHAANGELLVDLAALDAAREELRPLVRVVERLHIERRDAKRWQRRLHDNVERNLAAVAAAPGVDILAGMAARRPAFVLAAGPSARLAGRWLTTLRRFGPLIAVDTALPLCRAEGVHVDVLASVDPHPSSERHLKDGTDDVSWLAFQPYTCPEVVAAFARRVVAVPAGDRLCERLAQHLALRRVEASGTVLTYALDIANVLACDPIVLIGADFAHVGLQSHAPGTAHAVALTDTGVRARTASGALVPTSHALERFRAAVEQRIAGGSTRYLAVDGGGARIVGANMVSWVELAERLATLETPSAAPDWLASPAAAAVDADERERRASLVLREFDSE